MRAKQWLKEKWTCKELVVVGLLAGALTVACVGEVAHVRADDLCGTIWSGQPSGEPTVTWDCDDQGRLERTIHPVNYQQTMQNPCENSTYDPRDCTYSLGDPTTTINNNGTPDDPSDDYEVTTFKKIDSCRDVSGTVESNPNICCQQHTP